MYTTENGQGPKMVSDLFIYVSVERKVQDTTPRSTRDSGLPQCLAPSVTQPLLPPDALAHEDKCSTPFQPRVSDPSSKGYPTVIYPRKPR